MLPERQLIARIRRMAGRGTRGGIVKGIGDDCAVLQVGRGYDSLVTTDYCLEGVHFRRDWHSPESVGHRCMARGLSDIAAMGGEPVAVFLSLALPGDLPQGWVRRFMRGLVGLAEKYGASLAGGDTAQSPEGILADIIVVGRVPKGKAILRSGARPEDRIYVSGELGGSAAAVAAMVRSPKKRLNPRTYWRHFFPEPRVEIGRLLREKKLASSMIDLSDGLSTDLSHICEESGVGAETAVEMIPRAKMEKAGDNVGLDLALHGGEDYELLFTVPEDKRIPKRIAGVALTCIGQIVPGHGVFVRRTSGAARRLKPGGWEHFRS
ncbi:MAG TPA: thiamine-phosphate kinase [Candidatus Sulfotelmatobacter sp.]|nr:thiamine-phosphate kinase [Candidatus Sulfotelmatobacter sp.]